MSSQFWSAFVDGLPDGNPLAGTEVVPVVDAGTPQQVTAQDIANLAPSDLPSQTGNSGKFLTTDGSAASWGTPAGGSPGGSLGQVQFNNTGFGGATALLYGNGTSPNVVINNTGQPAGNVVLRITAKLGGQDGNLTEWLDAGGSLISRIDNGGIAHFGQLYASSTEFGVFGSHNTQQAANQAVTDSTTGSASTTLVDVTNTGLADPALCNNNFASLAARLAEIRSLLLAYGLGS